MKCNLMVVLYVVYPCILCGNVQSSSRIAFANKQDLEEHSLINGFQIETSLNITDCLRHFRYIMEGMLRNELWAMRFMDSCGSIPSGILTNHVISFGDFDQCLEIHERVKDEEIKGQYCLARIPVRNIGKISEDDYVSIGVCMPSSCNAIDIQGQLVEAMELLIGTQTGDFGVFSPNLCTSKTNLCLQTEDYFIMTFFLLVGFLVILSTAYQCFITPKKFSENINETLTSFSLLKNGINLFTLAEVKPSNGTECLHGIWCASMILLVLGSSFDGFYRWESNVKSSPSMPMLFLVDTLLLIEGFSIARIVFEQRKTKSYLSIPRLCFRKYLQLTTALAATILFCSTLFKYIGSGPVWKAELAVFNKCRRYWWSALGHIQAFVNPNETCLEDSWYISTSMQLYTISLALLLPFRKWRLKSTCGVAIFIIVTMTSSYFTLEEQHGDYSRETSKGHSSQSRYLIFHTIHGATAWLIGILLGYIVLWNKERSSKIISTCRLRVGWALSFLLVTLIITFTIDRSSQHAHSASIENILIKLFSRFTWSLNICWVIFVCSQGTGGPLNSFLSSKIWIPLSRCSYGMYVIHSAVNIYVKGSTMSSYHPSYMEKMQYLLGNFIVTIIIAICFGVALEFPILNLEALFWRCLKFYLNRNKYNVERQTISVEANRETINI